MEESYDGARGSRGQKHNAVVPKYGVRMTHMLSATVRVLIPYSLIQTFDSFWEGDLYI